MHENVYGALDLVPGLKLRVPLRCACPTGNQTREGVRFILTYLVTWGDSIPKISKKFNVSNQSVAYANGFSKEDPINIFPFTTLLIPLSAEQLSSQTRVVSNWKKESKRGILIGIGVGTSSAVLCFLLFMIFSHCKRNRILERGSRKWVLPKHIVLGIARVDDQVLKIYKFNELEEATQGFSFRNRLSDSVFKGFLGGKTVAIKKMSRDASKEVKIIQKINHFNLISLYGACKHDRVCYLVYEFMENGSLKQWLRENTDLEKQNWNHRIRIALDIAKGLQYLHNFINPAYVHKDINSSNILLNRDLRAKISNFSLARSEERDENGISSIKRPFELKGYVAPEYLESGLVTSKIDVYAFGVVLLELITGREAVYEQDGKEVMLSEAVLSIMENERDGKHEVNYLVDPRLQVKHPLGFIIDRNELTFRMVKLSVACLEPQLTRRLSMVEVVSALMMIQLDAQNSEAW